MRSRKEYTHTNNITPEQLKEFVQKYGGTTKGTRVPCQTANQAITSTIRDQLTSLATDLQQELHNDDTTTQVLLLVLMLGIGVVLGMAFCKCYRVSSTTPTRATATRTTAEADSTAIEMVEQPKVLETVKDAVGELISSV